MQIAVPWQDSYSCYEDVDAIQIVLNNGDILLVKEDMITATSADGSTVSDTPMSVILGMDRQI